jgi:hypothetical protein
MTLELERRTAVVLPALLEDVALPLILRDKKYASFGKSFRAGVSDLLGAIEEHGVCGSPPNIETTKCTVRLDLVRVDGSLARYVKTQTIRCLGGGLKSYVEAFSTDGTVVDFTVKPGAIGRVWTESGSRHVETTLPRVLRDGETMTRTFSCRWENSFKGANEYWDQRQHHPSRNVEILIRFPKARPPLTWAVEEREGALTRKTALKARAVKGAPRPTLRLFVASPRLLHSYILRWTW